MKKRLLALILSAFLLINVVACNDISERGNNDTTNETTESTEETTSTDATTLEAEGSNTSNKTDASDIENCTKRYLLQEQCIEMQRTVSALWQQMNVNHVEMKDLREMLETLIPTECTLSEFAEIFSDYSITNEFYSDNREYHILIAKLTAFDGIEFQFQCKPNTHNAQTHQTSFELVAIIADFSVLFPEYSNLTVEQIKNRGEEISIGQGAFLQQVSIKKQLCYYRFNGTTATEDGILPQGEVILNPFYYPSKG